MIERRNALRALLIVSLCALPACIEGGGAAGGLPADFLEDSGVTADGVVDEDTRDVQVADADGEGDAPDAPDVPDVPDALEDVDADAVADGDADDIDDADVDRCLPGEPGCLSCEDDVHCRQFEEGADLCTGRWRCDEGTCVEYTVTCDGAAGGPCRESRCHPATGACVVVDRPDGSPCSDGDPCTPDDRCEAGVCEPGARMDCDDGNPCTEDSCAAGGCVHDDALSRPCDDGNPCTLGDSCNLGGLCAPGSDNICECSSDADCAAYDDGNACTGQVRCIDDVCKAPIGEVVTCAAPADPCQIAVCDPDTGDCQVKPVADGSGCDDGDPCTVGDVCQGGSCEGEPRTCPSDAPCWDAECNPQTGVCDRALADDGTSCGEAGTCLEGATCVSGTCKPAAGACGCEEDADCADHDDGDLCNGAWTCADGRCVPEPDTARRCVVDDPQCQTASCDGSTGDCVVEDVSDGTPCDDGDPCTTDDACDSGRCQGAPALCEGSGGCATGRCHVTAGCVQAPVGQSCDSADLCALTSGCATGACQVIESVQCPEGGPCLDHACDASTGECVSRPLAGPCDDEDPCTEEDTCIGGECSGIPRSCDDDNPCTADTCGPDGACQHSPLDGVVCDDGNGCTSGDVCTAGVCEGTPLAACECALDEDCAPYEDGNPCNGTLFCDEGTCRVDTATVVTCEDPDSGPCMANRCDPDTGTCTETPRADGLSCEPGDACVLGGACQAGACVGMMRPCDDGNPCTDDACDPELGCSHTPTAGGETCDDGNPCTEDTACEAGVCGGGENTCGTCEGTADCAEHEDGDACNGTLVCEDGACVVDPATVVTCEPSASPCVSVSCDPVDGACEETLNDGAACEDGDPCTVDDTCQGGVCGSGETLACEDPGACGEAACDPATGSCVVSNVAGSCDDGNPCTTDDACQGGLCGGSENICPCTEDEDCDLQIGNKCLGTPACGPGGCELIEGTAVECSSPDDTPCAFQACDPDTGECVLEVLDEGAPCDDGNICTEETTCNADGECTGPEVACDDDNPCTEDSCDPDEGCVHTPGEDGVSCDDGDQCTTSGSCEEGVCVGSGVAPECFCAGGGSCPEVDDACEGTYECVGTVCRKTDPVTCDPTGDEPCVVSVCDPDTGTCEAQNAPPGTTCDDGEPCTENDRCVAGGCFADTIVCDDDNPCTADSCVGGECIFSTLDGANCNDGDPCTVLSTCQAGQCGGGTFVCDCTSDNQCQFLNDGDLCNGTPACVDNLCVQNAPRTEVSCYDPDPMDCVDIACDPDTGACEEIVREDGASCNDHSVCTTDDACLDGECVGTPVVTCEDPDPDDCQDVSCDPLLGLCLPAPRPDGAVCDDGNACTEGDVCVAGACRGVPADCDDGKACTEDICSAELGCIHRRQFGACDDGDPCTVDDYCDSGTCVSGTNTCECDADVDCEPFDDGDACTGTYTCAAGSCVLDESTIPDCTQPDNPCVSASCVDGACVETDLTGPACDDGDPCTTLERCVEGVCEGEARCDDDNPCTLDLCDPESGECSYTAASTGTACDDGDPCTEGDGCWNGACEPGERTGCDCSEDTDCAAFEDDDLCDGTLVCDDGQCRVDPATVVTCPVDPGTCMPQTCNPATGTCDGEALPDGTPCNDGDPCTVGDSCAGGACAGTLTDCDDDDPCTEDICDAVLGCIHLKRAGPCRPDGACTDDARCRQGACAGVPASCDDGDPCTNDQCLAGIGCRHTPGNETGACDDGDPCTANDRCQAGVCQGQPLESCSCGDDEDCESTDLCLGERTCEDGYCRVVPGTRPECPADTACRTWSCVPETGECEPTDVNEGGSCNDRDVCTEGDTCAGGECVGDSIACPDDGEPCSSQACDPVAGCQPVDASEPCDDGDPCTVDDHCAEGLCRGLPAPAPVARFDDGDLSAWTLSSTSEVAGWRLGGVQASSAPLSLGAWNPDTGTLADPAGPWSASATHALVAVPAGAVTAEMRFAARLDVESDACLQVVVDDALIYEMCEPTEGFVVPPDGTVDLTAHAGADVEVAFVVDVASADEGGAGVYIDDVAFDWACPAEGGE